MVVERDPTSSFRYFLLFSNILYFDTAFKLQSNFTSHKFSLIFLIRYPLTTYYFFSLDIPLLPSFLTTENVLCSDSISFIKVIQIPTLQDLFHLCNSNNYGSYHFLHMYYIFSLAVHCFSCELGLSPKLNNNHGLFFLTHPLPHMHITGTVLKTLNEHVLIYVLTECIIPRNREY